MSEPVAFGFLNIDKPAQMTSHDVVARVRRGLKVKKVGHAGTLDPLATGVLVVCVGAATRLSEYVMHSGKQYRARIHLGVTTTTYDMEGAILRTCDASPIQRADVEAMLPAFSGTIEQIPPLYSAIKQGGRRLYDMARAGETIALQPRPVTISRLSIEDWSPPQFILDVACSSGTYIRSLAHDLGEKLGVGAHLAGLVRTASGSFTLDTAIRLDALLDSADWHTHLISVDDALAHIPAVYLDDEAASHVLHGRSTLPTQVPNGLVARAYDTDGRFIGILQADNGIWHPHKVFLRE